MSRQYWLAPVPPFHIADGTAVTAAALAELSPLPQIVLPANSLEVGSRIEFSAFGRLTTAATPGTWTFGLYIGTGAIASGQAIMTTGAITAKASLTNATWRFEGNAHVRAIGAAGANSTIMGVGELANVTTNGTDMAPATAPATLSFDSTVSNILRLGITPSVATGSITCHYFGVRLVN